MLGLLIAVCGLEGLYLHVPVWIVQKGSHLEKFAPLKERDRVKFLQSKNPK